MMIIAYADLFILKEVLTKFTHFCIFPEYTDRLFVHHFLSIRYYFLASLSQASYLEV